MAKKKNPPSPIWAVVILLVGAIVWVQQNFDGNIPWKFPDLSQVASPNSTEPVDWTKNDNAIRVATFNIQVLGRSKMGKPDVVRHLAKTIRFFDVVAIQEIRAVDQNIMPELVQAVNSEGGNYSFTIGPRLGRTTSKEQYAYVFDANKIELIAGSVKTVQEPRNRDRLHREPLVARFQTRRSDGQTPFSFSLINIHTDPDETRIELSALDDVYRAVQESYPEDDVILLGDLNEDSDHLGELGQVADIQWVIAGLPTNTRGTASYDNILFTATETREFTGRGGVFDLRSEFGLSMEEALEISDHLPVWAEFTATEAPLQIASELGAVAR